MSACTTPISTLATNVLARLEENYTDGPVFWNLQFEIYTYLAEAENDLLMLIGRPTQTVAVPFTLVPNTPWQSPPSGVFLITGITGQQSQLRKVNLYDMDFNQSSWGSDWQSDTSASGPVRWGNLGFNWFFVHPAPTTPQSVLLDAIQYPVPVSGYPYTGATTVPFHDETFQWLEMYASHMCRMKESGQDFQESLSLYKGYLEGAKRLTELEDKKDTLIFSPAFGPPAGVNSILRR